MSNRFYYKTKVEQSNFMLLLKESYFAFLLTRTNIMRNKCNSNAKQFQLDRQRKKGGRLRNQIHNGLWSLIGLSQHGLTSLQHDLVFGHLGKFLGYIRISQNGFSKS